MCFLLNIGRIAALLAILSVRLTHGNIFRTENQNVINTNCTCGVLHAASQNRSIGRIVGGIEANRQEWPMMVEISAEGDHFCGGTVLTRRHVITAAHCIHFPKTLTMLPIEAVDVFVGIHEVKGENAFKGGQRIGIKKAIVHPNYHYAVKSQDVAILYLENEIDFTRPYAGAACLPVGTENLMHNKVTILGWGKTEHGTPSDSGVLMKVDVDIVKIDDCLDYYKYFNRRTNICTYTRNKDACQGDSGGPVLWVDPETKKYVLVGITSYGRKCARVPSVSINIIHFLPWIQSVIADTDENYRTCAKIRKSN